MASPVNFSTIGQFKTELYNLAIPTNLGAIRRFGVDFKLILKTSRHSRTIMYNYTKFQHTHRTMRTSCVTDNF